MQESLPKPDAEDEIEASKAPLLDHLIELRQRLIYAAVAFFAMFLICFTMARHIYDLLVWPYVWASGSEHVRLIATHFLEQIFTHLKLAMFGAAFLSFPVIATQIYKFVAPGLYKNERAAFLPFLVASPLLFLLGASLVYFVFTPMVMWFFLAMQQAPEEGGVAISLLPRVSEYLSLIMTLIFSFGLVFQLPVVTSLLVRVGLLESQWLADKRKYFIVVAFVIAAVVTPPDPLSQIGLALPTILLYEVAIYAARLIEKKRAATDLAEVGSAEQT